jgi:hypothetical protein
MEGWAEPASGLPQWVGCGCCLGGFVGAVHLGGLVFSGGGRIHGVCCGGVVEVRR